METAEEKRWQKRKKGKNILRTGLCQINIFLNQPSQAIPIYTHPLSDHPSCLLSFSWQSLCGMWAPCQRKQTGKCLKETMNRRGTAGKIKKRELGKMALTELHWDGRVGQANGGCLRLTRQPVK